MGDGEVVITQTSARREEELPGLNSHSLFRPKSDGMCLQETCLQELEVGRVGLRASLSKEPEREHLVHWSPEYAPRRSWAALGQESFPNTANWSLRAERQETKVRLSIVA